MAIKNSRVGKRGSSSSSSYAPTITTFLFVAACVVGVWFFTSSSSSVLPSHATTTRHGQASTFPDRLSSRRSRADPPPALDDTQGDLPEDAVKGDETLQQEKTAAGSTEEEEQSSKQEQEENQVVQSEDREQRPQNAEQQEQEQEKEQQNRNEQIAAEEVREQHDLEQQRNLQNGEEEQVQGRKDERNAEEAEDRELQQQRNQQNGEEEQVQRRKDEKNAEEVEDLELQQQRNQQNAEREQVQQWKDERNAKEEEKRELQQQRDEQNGEEEQKQKKKKKKKEHNSEQELQQNPNETNEQQEQSTDQTNDSTDEQNAMTTIGEETQQESNVNQEEAFHPEIDVNVQKQIEEGDSESRTASEASNGDGGGSITSQSLIEHVSEGSTDEQKQQEEEQEQQQQHQSEEESNESQQQDDVHPNGSDSIPEGSRSEVSSEKGKTWATQAAQSVDENARRKEDTSLSDEGGSSESSDGSEWELCNATAGPDYIPCLDNEKAIKQLHSLKHFEHRERHCPEESQTCLVPLPDSYKRSIEWPQSRDRIWYNNVPHTKLAEVKGHQNWVKVTGEYLTFPGGGTQFIHGALHYIDFIQKSARPISWGKHTRVVLDVGCGVASFGGYLFERDVLTMSFAPKDEHEAQVQFALERGIPAISAVMGSQRLPFPSRVFDVVHCARCRVPWHANGGALLLELNRVLRPGGFFVWSATPVYQKLQEDVEIWKAMTSLTKSMCWDLYTTQMDKLNGVGNAFYRKPISNDCYNNREDQTPPMCQEDDNPNAAWYVPLQACIHPVPTLRSERGSRWPEEWPQRLLVPPYWLNSSRIGVYGKPEPNDFTTDYEHWKDVVTKSYLTGFGIDWSKVRNVMDMRAVYGGFAAALKDEKLWVMNVVNVDSPDTLPIIYERGLFGMYHDWCESFSTYPRTYDLLHADHLFSQLKNRCKILPVVVEVDRIVRPGGKLIVRDESAVLSDVESLLKSLHWEIRLTFSKNQEGMLCAEKSDWRPEKRSDSF